MELNQPELVAFSQCAIWRDQKNFYEQQGIQAWSTKVPFYATSNPTIANSYANIIFRYWQDCMRMGLHKPLEPWYIVELGAGSGTFSFYLIKRLAELQTRFKLLDMQFVYVMTDFVADNINFWRDHPSLQIYIQQGKLDFAQFHIEKDQQLSLLISGAVLEKKEMDAGRSTNNPMIVIANYVFDTLPQDVFYIQDEKCQIGMIAPDAAFQVNDIKDKLYMVLPEFNASFKYCETKLPYYDDPNIEAVLTHYQNNYKDGKFTFPISVFKAVKNFIDIADGKLLLLVSDKGFAQNIELYKQYEPDLVFHDQSFSMQVNLHAIGSYFKQLGGDYYHQNLHQTVNTSIFMLGNRINQLPETHLAITYYLDNVSHNNLLTITQYLENIGLPYLTGEMIVSLLMTSLCDPHVFIMCFNQLLYQIKTLSPSITIELQELLPKVAANYYYLPGGTNVLAYIGVFFQETGNYRTALYYHEHSLQYFDQADTTYYNMGLCYYLSKEFAPALTMFQKALAINPQYIMARGWVAQIESEMGVTAECASNQLNSQTESAQLAKAIG